MPHDCTENATDILFAEIKGLQGCFPLCHTDRSEIRGTAQGKWNDIFQLNRANQ